MSRRADGRTKMGSASSTARVSRDPAKPAFGCICATMSPASGSPISPLPRSIQVKRWIAWASNRATSPSPSAVIRSLTACAPPGTICSDAAGHPDMPVTVHKARGRFKPLPMRLVITPKPPDIAERARDVARHNARKDQHDVDPRTLRAAGYMILITSLDAIAFPPQLLVRLYRVRWEIDIDQAWRLSRFCCWGGVSAFDPWRGLPPMRRGRSNCFQGRDRLGIRQDQFGALGAGASGAARQSALLDPGVKGRLRHPDFFGEFANRPFVRPALDPRRTSAIFDGLCA